ncbi:hypothetical protein E2C01_003688 [Portunus trituberculatus]|uniref:Uncharacterized protein n=1 Tax=Portunus trituberculatus TaxID=210409 RepID=A0A5B7CRW5_PORTR|nr:hypothetical protein [Portunus trituberculatus]
MGQVATTLQEYCSRTPKQIIKITPRTTSAVPRLTRGPSRGFEPWHLSAYCCGHGLNYNYPMTCLTFPWAAAPQDPHYTPPGGEWCPDQRSAGA